MAQTVKSLPAVWETWVRSQCREDPLEKEMTTYSSTLAWNPMDRRALQATVHGVAELDTTEQLHFTFFQKLEKIQMTNHRWIKMNK